MGGIAGILSGIPLLFTVRTEKEGGKAGISPEEYESINLAAARSGFADLVDVGSFFPAGILRSLSARIQETRRESYRFPAMIFRRPTAGRFLLERFKGDWTGTGAGHSEKWRSLPR